MTFYIKAVAGMKHSVIYTDDSGKHYRFYDGTRAWRNHNPGNIHSGKISKKHNQIGVADHFAIFPDHISGHAALIDVLKTSYMNFSIRRLVEKFSPPYENNTRAYIKFLREETGIKDNKLIKNFSADEFEKLWKAIEKFESSKKGNIIEVYEVSSVRINKKGVIYSFSVGDGWLTKEECIEFAKKGQVDLEVCVSSLGSTYLRTPSSTYFQKKLEDIIDKKNEE